MDPVTSMPTSPNNIIHPTTKPNAKQGNHWKNPMDVPGAPNLMCILPPAWTWMRWRCTKRALNPVPFLAC